MRDPKWGKKRIFEKKGERAKDAVRKCAEDTSMTDREKATFDLIASGRRGFLSEVHSHACLVLEGTWTQ